jgi:chromosome segregation ATPase
MSDNVEQLQQRVAKRREKLEDAASAVELTQARFDASAAAYEQADADRKRLKTSLKLAKRRARRLAKEAKRATKLAHVTLDDRDDAVRELDEHLVAHDKRAAKLEKAEAALAAAPQPEVVAVPVKKAAPARKAPVKRTPVKKVPARKAPVRKAPVKKAPAPEA